MAVKSNVSAGNSARAARRIAREWPGPFRKSGSPKVRCVAPAETWLRMSARSRRGARSRGGRRDVDPVDPPPRSPAVQVGREANQRLLALPPDDEVGAAVEQRLGVERRVQPVQEDAAAGTDGADALERLHTQTQGGVHRNGDRGQAGGCDRLRVEALHGEVDDGGGEAGVFQKRQRRRQ